MDIGTLTGTIEIEDQLSHGLELAAHRVEEFAQDFLDMLGPEGKIVAGVAAGAAAMFTAITAAITALGVKGADVNDLANTFDHFAGSVENAESIMEAMREGTLNTVGDMTLMKETSKLLSSGTLENAEDFKTLTEAAFVLQNRGFGTTTEELGKLSSAMMTGRTRALQAEVGIIDLAKGQREYAESLGVEKLDSYQKKLADQQTIMNTLKGIVEEAGNQERDFGEEIEAAKVKFENFMDDLASRVAASPVMMEALKGIGEAFNDIFGEKGKGAIDILVVAMESFARFVVRLGIEFINFGQGVLAVWNSIKTAVLAVETAIVYLAEKLGNIYAFMASMAGKAHLMSPENVAEIQDAAVQLKGMRDSLVNQTKEAYAASNGQDALGKSLEAARQALIKTHEKMSEGGKAADAFVGPINKVTRAIADQNDGLDKHDKQLQDLIDSWTGESKKMDLVREAYEKLTPAQKDSYEVQQALVPIIQKMIDGHYKVSDAMMATYNAAIKAREQLIAHDKAMLEAKGITQDYIDEQKQMGKSEAEIATALGVSSESLKLYQADIKKASEELDAHMKRIQDFRKTGEEGAAAVAKGFAGMPLVLTQLGQSMGTVQLTAKQIGTTMGTMIPDNATAAQKAITDAMTASYEKLLPLNSEMSELVDKMSGAGVSGQDMSKALGMSMDTLIEKMAAAGMSVEEIAQKLNMTQDAVIAAAPKMASAWETAFSGLAGMFTQLGQAAGGTLGKTLGGLGQSVVIANDAMKQAKKLGDIQGDTAGKFGYLSVAFDGNAKAADRMTAGIAAAGTAIQGFQELQGAMDQRGRGSRALSGAMAGAKIGAIAGPWGMAVGAGVGALIGAFKGDPKWVQAQDAIAKDFGAHVSDETAKAIADSAKADFGGSMQASAIGHLADIIKEAGGVSKSNLEQMTARLHDTFSMIETHQMTIAQGTKVLDDNWATFAQAGTSSVGLLSKSLTDIVQLNDKFGTQSQAITQYLGQQGAAALNGFTTSLVIGAQAITALGDGSEKTAEQTATLQGIIDATAIHTQAAADAMSAGVMASFSAMVDAGMSYSDAVKNITPALDALKVQMQAAGLTGSQAFDFMEQQVALFSDAVAGPALQSVDGLTQGMVALNNMGQMNQDTFAALSGQVTQTFDTLVAKGYDGTTVMLGMKDSLQRMWEEQQEFGYKTDDATQALIDQAAAEGIVGEKHKSVNEQMLDASNRMVTVLEAIGKTFGADIPDQAMSGATKVQKALDSIKAPALTVQVQYNDPGFDTSTRHINVEYAEPEHHATGGIVGTQYLASGGEVVPFIPKGTDTVPAMLTPGERVLTVEQNQTYENYMEGPSNQEVVDAVNGLRADMSTKLPRALARSLHTGLVGLRVA